MFPRLLLTLALGAGLALTGAAPAVAAQPNPATPAVSADVVIGQPWSGPTYPVECRDADQQISCTPTNPSQVTAQQCFIGVYFGGSTSTVCTTFDGHVDAIKAAGGKALLVQYGCSVGDLVCVTFENAGRGMALATTAGMFAVASNTRFDTSSVLWTSAVQEWSFWQWAVLVVLFGAMVWAIAAAVVSGDRAELVGALVRTMIAIPAVPITLWLTGHLLNAVDDMTWYLIDKGTSGDLFTTLQSVMWAGGQANYFFAFLIHGLLLIAMVLLMLVFAFRNIVLAALIMVGPIAWMLYPARTVGPQWVVRYVSAIVVLLLTGPLTIGFLSLIIHGLANVKTIWNPQAWPLLFGLVLVAFAPFAVFGLFSFLGAVAADSVGSRVGSTAGHAGRNAASTAIRMPTRLGGLPAGVVPGGRGGSASRSSTVPSSSRPSGASVPAGQRGGAARSTSTAPSPASTSPSSTAPTRQDPPRPDRSRP